MAYGVDVEAVYYTDANLVDIGVLDKYEIDIDLAKEKDFQIVTPDYRIPINGYWYIPDTEYGGKVRIKSTDSEDEEATYEGRSWRGMLHEHIVEVEDRMDTRYVQGNIADLVNELIEENDLQDLFVCDAPYIEQEVDPEVDLFEVNRGTTLYDVIWGCARSIGFSYVFEFRGKKVHLIPILSEDYTEYMVYSSIGALQFKMEETQDCVNHYIVTSVDDTNKKRTIHLFTDGTQILPYATKTNPVQDSDYITNKSQQELFGVDEIVQYNEVQAGVVENYVKVTEAPKNWKRKFGNYFYKEVDNETEAYKPYEAVESVEYKVLKNRPKDWAKHYSNYFDRQVDGTGFSYSPVSANSILDTDNKKKVKQRPRDWKTDYSSYYYSYQSGTGVEYTTYSGVTKNKYTRLTKRPSDWSTNYTSYYRKVIEVTKTVDGKKKKYYVDVKKNEKGKYVAVSGDNPPHFKNHPYYRRDSYTVPPQFLKDRTYMIPNKEVAPAFVANTYYKQKMIYKAPPFVKGQVYKMVYDHYKSMIDGAIDYLEDQLHTQTQEVTLDDFIVNIGDTVGGRDEFTGETIVAAIDNINAKIDNGMLQVQYVIGGQ